ncbi:MAG: DNA repair protein RecO [Oscillospiraceae bacterium]|nr:DNA repair protein RecO [Oscillospiraceae bacterium]
MSHKEITGLVARAVEYKESDLILTVLTADEGKLTVSARGARRHNSPHAAAAQVLCCSRMVLSEYHERYTLKEAEVLETFSALREDLPVMALACYLADLAQTLAPEGDIFHLIVAALYALCGRKRSPLLVKAAFEMRALCDAGFDPTRDSALPPFEGDLALAARYVREADAGKVFSFTLGEEPLTRFAALCERCALTQVERALPSLEYYKHLTSTGT